MAVILQAIISKEIPETKMIDCGRISSKVVPNIPIVRK